jgi:hypothetical protein
LTASLCHQALIQHNNVIGMAHRGQAVRHFDRVINLTVE